MTLIFYCKSKTVVLWIPFLYKTAIQQLKDSWSVGSARPKQSSPIKVKHHDKDCSFFDYKGIGYVQFILTTQAVKQRFYLDV